jgi:1,4-alpha-glucan branching enzyme
VLAVCNFTPVPRTDYRIGAPLLGRWREILNSDASEYGGSGLGNLGAVTAVSIPWHGFENSLLLRLPPLAVLVLVPEGPAAPLDLGGPTDSR